MARVLDDLPTLGSVLLTYRARIHEPALAAEREAVSSELIEIGRRLDDPTFKLAGVSQLFNLRREAGDFKATDQVRAQLEELTERNPSAFQRVNAIARRATDHYLAGDLASAEATIEQLLSHVEANILDSREIYPGHLMAIRYQQGRIGELVPFIEQLVIEQPFRAYQAVLVVALARTGRHDAATDALNRLAAYDYDMPHDSNWFVGTDVLADSAEILGTDPSVLCCAID